MKQLLQYEHPFGSIVEFEEPYFAQQSLLFNDQVIPFAKGTLTITSLTQSIAVFVVPKYCS